MFHDADAAGLYRLLRGGVDVGPVRVADKGFPKVHGVACVHLQKHARTRHRSDLRETPFIPSVDPEVGVVRPQVHTATVALDDLKGSGEAVSLANIRVTCHPTLQGLGDRVAVAPKLLRLAERLEDAAPRVTDGDFKAVPLRVVLGNDSPGSRGFGVEANVVHDLVDRPHGRDKITGVVELAQHKVADRVAGRHDAVRVLNQQDRGETPCLRGAVEALLIPVEFRVPEEVEAREIVEIAAASDEFNLLSVCVCCLPQTARNATAARDRKQSLGM